MEPVEDVDEVVVPVKVKEVVAPVKVEEVVASVKDEVMTPVKEGGCGAGEGVG